MLQRVLLLFFFVSFGLACHSKKKDDTTTTTTTIATNPGRSTTPSPGSEPIMTVPLGSYRGFRYTTKTGVESEVYLGIPYAQPPVGDLRLEPPKEPLFFSGIRDAKNWGSICPPHFIDKAKDLVNGSDSNANEDCLTLNIIKPKNASNLPILVWIHGGGYLYGGARSFGYTGFADNYIPQGIIVVSIQYRVGTLGYLYDGSSSLLGNYGSLDQVKAIEYLYNYAPYFGGDKNKITVWGLSAGGCSSAELILSHLSRDMIAGAIEMSGSAFSYWGTGVTVKQNTKEFLVAINCTQRGQELKNCLKNKTVDEFYKAVEAVGYTTNYLDTVKWGPVVDGYFLKASPFQLAREAAPKPVIVGVSDKDAGFFGILGKAPYMQNLSIPIAEQANFNKTSFVEYVNKLVKEEYYDYDEEHTKNVTKLIIDYYVGAENQTNGYYLNKYIEWCDDMYFYGPAVDGIKVRNELNWTVYAYNFEQYNKKIYENVGVTVQEVMGSVHTNEYAYMYDLFNMGIYSMNGTMDGVVHDQLVAAIGSFSKHQEPRIPNKYWPPVGETMAYYQFKDNGAIKNGYHTAAYNFMRQLAAEGFDYSFLRKTSDLDRIDRTVPNSDPAVTTPLGTYRGKPYTTKYGTQSEIYLGIPYALPPKGNLRLEPPQDPDRFSGVMETKEWGPICPPHINTNVTIPKGMQEDEDCLTLNIFKPKNAKNLPVLVWIHGGGYIYGNAHAFGYKGFADNYNPQKIIVVTIQYRVGPLGYLSDKSVHLPGNYGSLDQVKAIEYIHKYISDFGGNRDKITVWGLSAGGCSASELVLSHLSRDMIAGAIEMSGSAFSYWGTGTTVRQNTEEFINATSCIGKKDKVLKDCLKTLTLEEFYQAVSATGATTKDLESVKWGPVVDGNFLQSSPFQLAREAPPKSIIVGASNKDAGYFGVLNKARGTMQDISIDEKEQATFNKTEFDKKIDDLVRKYFTADKADKAVERIQGHYPKKKASEKTETAGYYLNALVEFCNDIYFFGPAVDGIEARRNASWTIFAYDFQQFNEQLYEHIQVNGSELVKGSVHTNEYSYMFDLDWITDQPLNMTAEDRLVHDELVAAIASFARDQKPTIPNSEWPPVGEELNYYVFNGNSTIENNGTQYHKDTKEFMKELRDDYGFDLNFFRPKDQVDRDGENVNKAAFP